MLADVGLGVAGASADARASVVVPIVLGLVAVALDVAARATSGPTGAFGPPSVRQQVPVEWGRMFSAPVTAVLYGARLGIGPLTILSTWLWWAALFAGAWLGVWESVLIGACFGMVRLVVTAAASLRAEGDHVGWFGALRERTSKAWLGLDSAAALFCVAALAILLAGCTSGSDVDVAEGGNPDSASTAAGSGPNDDDQAEDGEGSGGPTTTDPSLVDPDAPTTPPTVTLPDETTSIVTSPDDIEQKPPLSSDELSARLIPDVAGFNRLTDDGADRFLSIDDAAAIQPDPTEELPLLETRGYQGGWTRVFRNDTQDVLVSTVYDFASALEADFYLEDGTITIDGYGGSFFEVESIPDARGFRQDSADEVGPLVTWGITFTRNNQWYLLYLLGDPATATPDILLAAAENQAALATN